MGAEITVAIISLCGTAVGSFAGVIKASQLTNYRIKCLEEKVDKHNCLVERMVAVEESTKSAHHRINEIKKGGT